MWAIDMTDVFVILVFTPSPSVLRTATSPSQEGEAMREGVKKGGFPLLS